MSAFIPTKQSLAQLRVQPLAKRLKASNRTFVLATANNNVQEAATIARALVRKHGSVALAITTVESGIAKRQHWLTPVDNKAADRVLTALYRMR